MKMSHLPIVEMLNFDPQQILNLNVDSIQREKMVDQSCICLPIPTCDDNSLSGPEIIPPCTTIISILLLWESS